MKRPIAHSTIKSPFGTGDIKQDFSQSHFAEIGAMAFAYNELEGNIDLLFAIACNLSPAMSLEVTSRINGMDGKVAVIRFASAIYEMSPEDANLLKDALDSFSQFKIYRDAIIHSQIRHAPLGIGIAHERKGKTSEVLISEAAVKILYDHMIALSKEIEVAHVLLLLYRVVQEKKEEKSSRAAIIREFHLQFLDHHKKRQSLPPIPRFPEESELREAEARWIEARRDALMVSALKAHSEKKG